MNAEKRKSFDWLEHPVYKSAAKSLAGQTRGNSEFWAAFEPVMRDVLGRSVSAGDFRRDLASCLNPSKRFRTIDEQVENAVYQRGYRWRGSGGNEKPELTPMDEDVLRSLTRWREKASLASEEVLTSLLPPLPKKGKPARKKADDEMMRRLREDFGDRCCYCARSVAHGNRYDLRAERDHIIPLSKGGPDTYENSALSCHECNGAKSDQSGPMWFGAGRHYWLARLRDQNRLSG